MEITKHLAGGRVRAALVADAVSGEVVRSVNHVGVEALFFGQPGTTTPLVPLGHTAAAGDLKRLKRSKEIIHDSRESVRQRHQVVTAPNPPSRSSVLSWPGF
jgi:hypothetical protein